MPLDMVKWVHGNTQEGRARGDPLKDFKASRYDLCIWFLGSEIALESITSYTQGLEFLFKYSPPFKCSPPKASELSRTHRLLLHVQWYLLSPRNNTMKFCYLSPHKPALRTNPQIWKQHPLWVPIVAQQKWIKLASMRLRVRSLTLLSGLKIWRCCELWCRSQMWLGSRIAMAVV